MRRTIRLKENELRRMISESVKRILNEIGDKNDFALDAVRGRRAAKQYYTNMNASEKAENNRVIGLAQDKMYKNYSQNHNLGIGNGPGYHYGFQKGLDKYANGDVSESHIKRTLRQSLNESYLYTKDIDTSDLRINAHWTDDGYAEWEATVDNGWYTFRGTYNGVDCELDEIIEGHSGYGSQHNIDDDAIEWFDENLRDKIATWIEKYADDFEE